MSDSVVEIENPDYYVFEFTPSEYETLLRIVNKHKSVLEKNYERYKPKYKSGERGRTHIPNITPKSVVKNGLLYDIV